MMLLYGALSQWESFCKYAFTIRRPGVYVRVARRQGNERFLGSLNNWDAQQLDLPLDFLAPGNSTAEIDSNANDAVEPPKDVRIEPKSASRSSHLQAALAPGGGYAVRFVAAL